MKKLSVILMICLLGLCGCSETYTAEPTMSPVLPVVDTGEDSFEETSHLVSVCVPITTDMDCHEDGTELFALTTQHIELVHPDREISEKIALDFLSRVDTASADAERVYWDAQKDYGTKENWYPYSYRLIYNPTRIDHRVLSFAGTRSSYNGGMHSSVSGVSLNYDMITGDVLTWGSIMHENADKDSFVNLILTKLSQVRDEYYLFDDYETLAIQRLSADENRYENFFFTATGLDFYFSPYEIAPYTSGIITVEIPYHELSGLLHDSYYPAEMESTQGRMRYGLLPDLNMDQFRNLTEISLADTEDVVIIYPEGIVEGVKITLDGDGMGIPDYTVFAAEKMLAGDAVVLKVSEAERSKVTVYYYTEESQEEIKIAS